jgi:hypothetical protein
MLINDTAQNKNKSMTQKATHPPPGTACASRTTATSTADNRTDTRYTRKLTDYSLFVFHFKRITDVTMETNGRDSPIKTENGFLP